MNKQSRIYIAGHRGMVGSAIRKRMEQAGYTGIIFRTHDELDLTCQSDVAAFFDAEKPEIVIDAAARVGGIMANSLYRAQFIYENLMIQSNIIHQSHLHNVEKLIFLGSSCIYPKYSPQPIKEEYLLTGLPEYTNEPYAIAKIAGIKMCDAYYHQYGDEFLSVMPTNLYGPNDNYNLETSHVLPAMIRKIYLGKCLENNDMEAVRRDLDRHPVGRVNGSAGENAILDVLEKYGISVSGEQVIITLWGTGSPMREFLHVDDLADAVVYVLEHISMKDAAIDVEENGVTAAFVSHINIGYGEDISIKDLSLLVKQIIGFKGSVEFDAKKPDGTPRKLLDVSRLFKMGWHPSIPLSEGIEQVYRDYIS